MMKFQASNLATSLYNFGLVSEKLVHQSALARTENAHSIVVSKNLCDALFQSISSLHNISNELNLGATIGAISRLIEQTHEFRIHTRNEMYISLEAASRFGWLLSNAASTFSDELNGSDFFKVQPAMEQLSTGDISSFGSFFGEILPTAVGDAADASMCLALGRPTATVFHLMRVMELAVQKISEHLEIEKIDKEWGKLLSDISKAVEKMPKGDDRDLWSEIHTHLYHVKQAWRNRTMHPKKSYTKQEASIVFDTVGSFIRHISSTLKKS